MTPRAAFLRALPGWGFAPPEADVAALGGELPAGDATDRFAADVRIFAAAFWSLAPADRRARWEALTARRAGPAAAWLAELGDALDVTPAAHADPAAAELAAALRELAILPGRERAARRRAWLADAPDRFAARRRATRVVLGDDLPLARLEPTLFDYFALGTLPGGSGGALGALWRLIEWAWDGAWKLVFLAVVIAICWLAIWVTVRAQAPCCVMGPVLAVCCYVIWLAPRAWARS